MATSRHTKKGKNKSISIAFLIPFYNERFSIVKNTILRILKQDNKPYSIYVFAYDDGSNNNTFYKLAKFFKGNNKVILIRNSTNNGQGYALKMLAKIAKTYKLGNGKHINYFVTFDADGQHNPKTAINMVNFAQVNKLDIVLGSRYLKGTKNYMPFARKTAVYLARFMLAPLFGKYYTDIQNGLRVFNRRSISVLTKIKLFRMEHSLEILYIIAKNKKYKVAEFPTVIKYTKYATSHNRGEASNAKILKRGFYIVKNFALYRLFGQVPSMYNAKRPELSILKAGKAQAV